MKIEIKAIKNKNNLWMPQEQKFFSQEIINDITEEEDLKENMICKQGVGFDSKTQTFTNVVFDCSNYNNEFIYLIKSKEIINSRIWHFAFVTNKNFNTSQKVILELTIDTVTSNYDLFYTNQFKGQIYVERTNNYERSANNIHSDVCSAIENRKNNIQEIELPINKNVDTFVSSNLINESKNFTIEGSSTGQGLDIEQLGEIIVNENNEMSGFNSFYKKITELNKLKIPIPRPSLEELVRVLTTNKKYSDTNWNFVNNQNMNLFKQQVQNAGIGINSDNLQRDIQRILELKGLKAWFSLPTIFNFDDPEVESSINSFVLSFDLKNINLNDHMLFHKNYFLILGTLFKIPLNFIKLTKTSDNKFLIFGKRIISMNKVVYSMFYTLNDAESFYDLNIELNNGTYQDEYYAYMRDKYNIYESGAQNSLWTNIAQTGAGVALGFAVSNPVGWASLALTATSWGFNEYRRFKNEQYKQQELKEKPRQTINVLSFEVFDKLLFNNLKFGQHYKVTIRQTPSNITYFYLNSLKDFKRTEINNFSLLIEEPIIDDQERILLDQKLNGNIVNQIFESLNNPLKFNDLTKEHLFWQGKIRPDINPVDNFQLDVLNETLAKGVYVYKIRPESFQIVIKSTDNDLNIKEL